MNSFIKFLIIANIEKDNDLEISKRLNSYFTEHGAFSSIVSCESDYENGLIKCELISDVECVIVLGGDGTMLRAAHTIGDADVCMIGVNFGTLGFLTEIDIHHIEKMADRLMAGDYTIEERMVLNGTITNGKNSGVFLRSLNDIVLSRSGILRLIALKIYVNGQLLDTYEADGIIVSTPTGSTGYNLSCGGPIVSPTAKLIVLTPISPHSMSKKSVIFDMTDKISVEVIEKRKTQENEAIVSFDGYANYNLSAGDRVDISVSDMVVKLVKMYDTNFYEILRSKVN